MSLYCGGNETVNSLFLIFHTIVTKLISHQYGTCALDTTSSFCYFYTRDKAVGSLKWPLKSIYFQA